MPSKVSWALLGASGGVLNVLWGPPEASWGHLAAIRGFPQRPSPDLECLGGRLGAILGRLGVFLGPSWGLLGRHGALLGRLDAFLANLGAILGASWAVSDARKTEESSIRKLRKNLYEKQLFVAFRELLGVVM